MTWLENAILGNTLDVTGWDQHYQAQPQPEKRLDKSSKVNFLY